jgi:hypothetical protein
VELVERLAAVTHCGAHDLGTSFSDDMEMRSYKDFVPMVGVKSPTCYFAGDGAGGPVRGQCGALPAST